MAVPIAGRAERAGGFRPTALAARLCRWPGLLDLAAGALLLLLTLLFYWRILTPDAANRAAFPKGDFSEQFYAFAYFRAQELLAGRLPLWNPYAFGGGPFLADIQSAIFYPPSWLTTLLAGPRGFPLVAYEAEAVAHIFLAGLFTYLLVRRLSGSRFGGLVAGVVFAFGGYLSSYPSQQLSILEVQVWLPLALLVAHEAARHLRGWPGLAGFAGAAALILAVSLTAGHPQAAMYVFYGYFAYVAFRTAVLWRDGGRAAWRTGLALLLPIPLALAIAAVQVLPTYEFSRLSTRSAVTYDFTAWGFPVQDILQFVLPRSVSLMAPMYVGIVPLALAAGAFAGPRRREAAFWGGLALVAFLVSFGGHTFLYSPLYLFAPGLATFRDQERAIYLFSLAAAILAGLGAATFPAAWGAAALRRAGRLLLALAGAAFAMLFLLWLANAATRKFETATEAAGLTLIIALLGALLCSLAARGLPSATARALLLALIAFDLFSVNWQINVAKVDPASFYRPDAILTYLRDHAAEGRVFNEYQYPLNYGDVFRVRDANGASPLVIAAYDDLLKQLPRERALALIGVRYFVTWQGGYPGGKRLLEADKKYLYELPEYLPGALVVNDVVVEPDATRALALLGAPDFDYRGRAVVPAPLDLPPAPPRPASVVVARPDYLEVALPGGPPGLLVLPETYYPGWHARVDGQERPVLRVNHAFRGVVLPADARRAEFVFAPDSVRLGGAVSVAGLGVALGLVGWSVIGRFRERRFSVNRDHALPVS